MFSFQDLTVCIPFYRAENLHHLKALIHSIKTEYPEIQIVVSDNGSPANEQQIIVKQLSETVQFLLHPNNIGRAANRNSFLQVVKTPLMLFLDTDSLPVSKKFISQYLIHATDFQVICGGTAYSDVCKPGEILRWKFGKSREVIDVEIRKKNPYHSFMTNNFLIPTEIFRKYHFDERLKEYGHEDSLFGLLLEMKKIPIAHIENRVYHTGLETSEIFLTKTRQGIENLIKISQWEHDKPNLSKISKLWRVYKKMDNWLILKIVNLLSFLWLPLFEWNLKGKNPNLKIFDIYKLLYLFKVS